MLNNYFKKVEHREKELKKKQLDDQQITSRVKQTILDRLRIRKLNGKSSD